jgi:type IV secretory pathway VirD2 relaxase
MQYARATINRGGRYQYVYMHRLVMDAPPGHVVDHINGDTLDNRRENLRIITAQENSRFKVLV